MRWDKREGGGVVICGGGKRRLGSSWVKHSNIFWRWQGRSVGNPVGVARAGHSGV